MAKTIALLGSTGSVGRQTLDVVAKYPQHFKIDTLAAYNNVELLAEQAHQFLPRRLVLLNPARLDELGSLVADLNTQLLTGETGLMAAVSMPGIDLVVAAMVGVRSLSAVFAAIEAGKDIALANKEILVAAGQLLMEYACNKGRQIIPIDSEHSAIFQCLRQGGQVEKIIITASGGPLRQMSCAEMATVTPEQALKHPTWSMGPKISIDSATLMNKGLEVIEAKHLFNLEYQQIEVLIHPQSIVHALVQYNDGALFAHMGPADMRIPIQYALSWPERWDLGPERLDLASLGSLHFSDPDLKRFPCLDLAYQAGRAGGTCPAVLNGANEIAVHYFLTGKILLTDIGRIVAAVLEKHQPLRISDLEQILAVDRWARKEARTIAERFI